MAEHTSPDQIEPTLEKKLESNATGPNSSVVAMKTSIHEVIRRDIKPLEILSLGFNICNSWIAISTALAIAISAGGTVTVLYGIIIATIAYLAIVITLAELASVYPTAGGQYHFASILCPEKIRRPVSYVCGLAATSSWVFLAAAITILSSQLLIAVPAFYIKDYVPQPWHYFLVFQAINIVLLVYNIYCLKKTAWLHNIGFAMSLVMFLVILVTCIALSSKQSSATVWTTFDNATGWPAGVTFLTGLVTPASMYGGIDAVLHLAEEVKEPEKTVPRALMAIITIGFISGFSFAIAMCYGIQDLESLMGATIPIYDLWRQAAKSDLAGTIFVIILHIITLFAVLAVQQTASRMTWAFARDGGLPGRSWLAHVDDRKQVPVWSLLANALVIFVSGCIYLGSMAAFSAIIGSSLILQLLSFVIPSVLLMWHKRSDRVLPHERAFRVPSFVGWTSNVVTVIFGIIFAVFFTFPGGIPVSGMTMNYAVAVIAIVGIMGAVNWFVYAKKHFAGPDISEYLRP
ncbi:amino acid transporter [Sarocladium strictum]